MTSWRPPSTMRLSAAASVLFAGTRRLFRSGNRKDVFVALSIVLSTTVLFLFLILKHHREPSGPSLLPDAALSVALSKVSSNPEVVQMLGTPIDDGNFRVGKVQQDETGWTEIKLSVPIHGPKGKATMRLVAGTADGTWTFSTLEVLAEQSAKPVDLVRGTLDVAQEPSFQPAHSQPAAAAEFLPFTTAKPAWDGSHPYLTVNLGNFQSSITREAPSLLRSSPVNQARVHLGWGRFNLSQTDFFAGGDLPLDVTRSYQGWIVFTRTAFGLSANHPFDICPFGSRNPYTYLYLMLGDGTRITYERISKGTGYSDAVYRHSETASEFYGSQIAWNGRGWTLTFEDGRQALFPDSYNGTSPAQGAPVEIKDASGNHIQLIRDGRRNLRRLLSSSGHFVDFWYDSSDRVIEARDDAGKVRKYSYGIINRHLTAVSDASRVLYRFEYAFYLPAGGFVMTAIYGGDGKEIVRNEYADHKHVSRQRFANGDVYEYEYYYDGPIVQAVVTLPGGEKKVITIPHPQPPPLY